MVERDIQTRVQEQQRSLLSDDGAAEVRADSRPRTGNAPCPWRALVRGGLAAMMSLVFALMIPATLPGQIPAPPGAPTQEVPLPHPEIEPPNFPSPTITPWWVVAGGILMGLGLLSLLVWYAWLPKRLRPPSLRHAPLRSAIESLEALRGRVKEMAPSEVAHDVSLIIRMYLQQTYSLPAPYRTTEEIYRSAALATREPLKHRFEPVAVFYDQVEFAPRPRTVADSERLVDAALEALREEQRLMAQPSLVAGTSSTGPLAFNSQTPPPLPSSTPAVTLAPVVLSPAPPASALDVPPPATLDSPSPAPPPADHSPNPSSNQDSSAAAPPASPAAAVPDPTPPSSSPSSSTPTTTPVSNPP